MNTTPQLPSPWRIVIIGGGPAGLTLARILAVNGVASTVYEAEEGEGARWSGGTLDLRPKSGRRAIREAHLEKEFDDVCRYDAQELFILDHKANVLLSHKAAQDQPREHAAPEINRGDLRNILLSGLDPNTIFWGHKLASAREIQREEGQVEYELEFTNGNKVTADLVIGADGTFSKTRTFLMDPRKPTYTGVTLVQLMISPDPNVSEADRFPGINELVGQGLGLASDFGKCLILQRESHQMIRLYASQYLPQDATILPDVHEIKRRLMDDFMGWDQKFLNFIEKADDKNAVPWKIYAADPDEQREVKLGVTLIGDANKYMSPYAGEGANTAMADSADLALTLSKAVATLSPTASSLEKSQTLFKAQQEFAEVQFPRAQKAARKSAEGLRVSLNQPAQARADQIREQIKE